jgi:hypothetical protein
MPDLTYQQLQKALVDLATTITRDAEAIRAHGKTISDEATDTARVAEQIAGMRVDTATIAETRELAKIMEGVPAAVIAYASAGDTTARTARAAHATNHAHHDGINDAARRSPVGREIYDLDSGWLTQE